MGLLMRSGKSGHWQSVDPKVFTLEQTLEHLLAESPSIIPMEEIRSDSSALVCGVRQFPVSGSGFVDIVAFSPEGNIALVECKLAANPEAKRKVIGQIMEYAAYLWGHSYEQLDERIKLMGDGQNLADLVRDAAANPEWDAEQFKSEIAATLKNGTFILVIAVDRISEELARTIEYLNACGNLSFSMHALEIRHYSHGDEEVLVPHVHGRRVVPPPPERGHWTEERFLTSLGALQDEKVIEVVTDLLRWTQEKADRTYWGTGKETGSFTFHYLPRGKTASVFTVYSDGRLMLNYGWLAQMPGEKTARFFSESVHVIPTLARLSTDPSKWPTIKIKDAFAGSKDSLQSFKQAVLDLGTRIRDEHQE